MFLCNFFLFFTVRITAKHNKTKQITTQIKTKNKTEQKKQKKNTLGQKAVKQAGGCLDCGRSSLLHHLKDALIKMD